MGGDFATVVNSVNSAPLVTENLVTSLTANLPYRFMVQAYNYNGAGANSSVATFYPCDLPTGMATPTRTASTTTDITISWTEPTSHGSCPITGYVVYVDDGAGGAFVEANADNDISVRNLPSLNSLTVTRGLAGNSGSTFRFKVQAYNWAGYVESPTVGIVLASVPLTPPTAPDKVTSGSSATQITIDWTDFTTAYNGGSSIVSYNV